MKMVINYVKGLAFTILAAMAVISCDPCSGVVCEHASCSNGTCICEEGYLKTGASCYGVNMGYVDTTGTGIVSSTQLRVDSLGNSTTITNFGLKLVPDENNPYLFTLENFNSTGNNILFTVSSTNPEVISSGVSGIYTTSGSKTGSQVQLVVYDTVTKVTYTLTYTIT